MKRFYLWLFFLIVLLCGCILVYLGKFRFSKNIGVKDVNCILNSEEDSQIKKFLNFETPFSSDEIAMMTFNSKDRVISKLGIESISRAEGLLLGYLEKNDNVLMIVGFDDFDGKRFIVPIRIPITAIEDKNNSFGFIFNKVNSENLSDINGFDILKTRDGITSLLDSLIGKVFVLMFTNESLSKNDSDYLGKTEVGKKLLTELDKQLPLTRSLLGKLNNNGFGFVYKNSDYNLPQTNSMCDIKRIEIDNMPIVLSIITDSNFDEK